MYLTVLEHFQSSPNTPEVERRFKNMSVSTIRKHSEFLENTRTCWNVYEYDCSLPKDSESDQTYTNIPEMHRTFQDMLKTTIRTYKKFNEDTRMCSNTFEVHQRLQNILKSTIQTYPKLNEDTRICFNVYELIRG